jgi:NitT/TauT family transport system substrate-binding protein
MPKLMKLTLVAALLLAFGSGRAALAQKEATIRISFNPVVYSYLPLFVAIDKGYFKAEHIDLKITTYHGSSVMQMPSVARGDIDIAPMVIGPAMFNQHSQGFDLKVIASMVESHPGWHDGEWIVARKDLYDSGKIRTLADLKGKSVDGGPDGSPISFIVDMGLKKAGLTRADVKYSQRLRDPSDWIAAMRNKAVDAIGTIEPFASILQDKGYAVKIASDSDVAPWFQVSFFVASEKYVKEHRDAAVRFFKALLKAEQEVNAAGPKWTTYELDEVSKWSRLPVKAVAEVPGPTYYGQFGKINADSIAREEAYWISTGTVTTKVPASEIIDSSVIDAARKDMGIH